MAIFVGGMAALIPSRRDELAGSDGGPSFATLATLMTACVAGMFTTGEGVLLGVSEGMRFDARGARIGVSDLPAPLAPATPVHTAGQHR